MNTNTHTNLCWASNGAAESAPTVNMEMVYSEFPYLSSDPQWATDCYEDYLTRHTTSCSDLAPFSRGEYWTNEAMQAKLDRELDL